MEENHKNGKFFHLWCLKSVPKWVTFFRCKDIKLSLYPIFFFTFFSLIIQLSIFMSENLSFLFFPCQKSFFFIFSSILYPFLLFDTLFDASLTFPSESIYR